MRKQSSGKSYQIVKRRLSVFKKGEGKKGESWNWKSPGINHETASICSVDSFGEGSQISSVESVESEGSTIKRISFLLFFRNIDHEVEFLQYYYSDLNLSVFLFFGIYDFVSALSYLLIENLPTPFEFPLTVSKDWRIQALYRVYAAFSTGCPVLCPLMFYVLKKLKVPKKLRLFITDTCCILSFPVAISASVISEIVQPVPYLSMYTAFTIAGAYIFRIRSFVFQVFNVLMLLAIAIAKILVLGDWVYVLLHVGLTWVLTAAILMRNHFYERLMRDIYVKNVALKKLNKRIKREVKKGSQLLENMFPLQMVDAILRSIENDENFVRFFDNAILGQIDIVEFTRFSASVVSSSSELIHILNTIICDLDRILLMHQVEKFSNTGDGIIFGRTAFDLAGVVSVVDCALALVEQFDQSCEEVDLKLKLRCGLGCGEMLFCVTGNEFINLHILGRCKSVTQRMEASAPHNSVKICEDLGSILAENPNFELQRHNGNNRNTCGDDYGFIVCERKQSKRIATRKYLRITDINFECLKQCRTMLNTDSDVNKPEEPANKWERTKQIVRRICADAKVLFNVRKMVEIKATHFVKTSVSFASSALQSIIFLFILLLEMEHFYFYLPISILSFLNMFVVLCFVFILPRINNTNSILSSWSIKVGFICSYIGLYLSFLITIVPLFFLGTSVRERIENEDSTSFTVHVIMMLYPLLVSFSGLPNVLLIISLCCFGVIPVLMICFYEGLSYMYYLPCVVIFLTFAVMFSLFDQLFLVVYDRTYNEIIEKRELRTSENARNRLLIHSVLPHEIASEMLERGHVSYKEFEDTCVCFTKINKLVSILLSAEEKMSEVSVRKFFNVFSKIIEALESVAVQSGCIRIKTLGVMYLVLALPDCVGEEEASLKVMNYVLDIRSAFNTLKVELVRDISALKPIYISTGVSKGSVSCGVVGARKVQLECYGATVNLAARLNQMAGENEILICESIWNDVGDLLAEKGLGVESGLSSLKGICGDTKHYKIMFNGVVGNGELGCSASTQVQ